MVAENLNKLRLLQKKHAGSIIVYPGDIFHKWKSSPSLINFAIKHLPYGYAIPGQHDLPYHDYREINKSAYWTLVESGTIVNIEPGKPLKPGNWYGVYLHGFPWGFRPEPIKEKKGELHLAVIHSYIWSGRYSYPGAPQEKNWTGYVDKLKGFTAAVFGDNHKGFLIDKGKVPFANCGGFMRRNSDEVDYVPRYTLFWSDGTLTQKSWDQKDKWTAKEDLQELKDNEGLESFIELLKEAKQTTCDFRESVKRYLDKNKVKYSIRKLIIQILEGE